MKLKRTRLFAVLPVLMGVAISTGLRANDGLMFKDGFEGGSNLGRISGILVSDPDADGDLADGVPLAGATVYLDSNFNGRLDDGEPVEITAADGGYLFEGLTNGIKHVRQFLPPPNVQTFPPVAGPPVFDGGPDEVISYVHSAPGLGDFDVPYGKNASDWPPEWSSRENGPLPEPVSPDLVLKPLGVRNRTRGGGATKGVEALCLPLGAALTLRFDEPIIDGLGPDLRIYTLASTITFEEAEVLVGTSPDVLVSMGVFDEALGTIDIDLAGAGLDGPVYYVQLIGQDLGGEWKGFDLIALEALNVAVPDPGAHIVVITPDEREFTDRDFGRFFQDLPPELTISGRDGVPATPGLRVGEAVQIELAAYDDLGVQSVSAQANGNALNLDANLAGQFVPAHPGELVLVAQATDSAGQTTERSATWYVLSADGSDPLNPTSIGRGQNDGSGSPLARILTPAPGESLNQDVEVIASISVPSGDVDWLLEYAPADLVDPYALDQPDADYVLLSSGSGRVISEPIGTLPLALLPDGIYFLRLTATSSTGRSAWFGQVVARNVDPSELRPQVLVDAPVSGDIITMTADIEARILSSRPVVQWFVEYAPASQVDLNNLGSNAPDWRRIGEGSGALPVSTVLASFDGTLLRNGSYVVRIVARNDLALGWVEPLVLEVSGEAKLGRNRLEFVDIEIDLAGFPLRLTRVYDSLSADRSGDFGYGWSLQLQDADVGETVPDTGVLGVFGSTPFRVGTRVYLNAPSGERLGFTFEPEPGAPSIFGTPYRVVFRPDPGNYYQLEVPQGDQAFLALGEDGNMRLFSIALPWNPEVYVLVSPDGKRYTIHEDHGLQRAEDLNGNRLDFGPRGIFHSAGPQLRFERDALGRITAVSDPDSNVWSYEYDADGNLASSTDPDLETTVYQYFDAPAHYLDRIIDPQGRQPRRFEYDPGDGRLVAVIDENGNRRESLIDPRGFSGLAVDARGNVTEIQYDARGNVLRKIDPQGFVTEYEYGDPANPDRETLFRDGDGEEWRYSWNALGLPTTLFTPLAIGGAQRVDLLYDESGRLTRFKDQDGRVDEFAYDELGNRILESPASGVTTNFAYGPGGRLLRRELSQAEQVLYGWDANGYLAERRDSYGEVEQYLNLRNGRLLQRSDSRGTLDVGFTPAGRLNIQIDAGGGTAELVTESDGSLRRTDRNGNLTRVESDAEGRPVRIILPGGGEVETAYDPEGNPASITDPLGNLTRFRHDSANRLALITDALGETDSYRRDRHGNITEIIDRNGKRRTFEWDANRRITFERWFDDGGVMVREIEFAYVGTRGLVRVDDRFDGQLHQIEYQGRLPRPTVVDYNMPGQAAWKVRYDWSSTAESPTSIRATADNNTSLARIQVDYFSGRSLGLDWLHPQSGSNLVRMFRNPDGSLGRVDRSSGPADGNSGSRTEYGYDRLGRLNSIVHLDAQGALLHPNAELSYLLDAEGRVLSESHAGNTATYSYDADGQLTGAIHDDLAYPDESYDYDLAGNRIGAHRFAGSATISVANRITAAGDDEFEYDAAGNLIRWTDTVSGRERLFGYDHRNRLATATVHASPGAPAEHTLRFEYDYLDRLLFREIDGLRTWVLHDREQPFVEFVDGLATPSAAYLYDPDEMDQVFAVWRDDALGERWFLNDVLGSIRGITNGAFEVQSWVDYDGFGNLQPGDVPAAGEPLGFAARPLLPGIGLYDNRRRFYAPELGRFTQEDPVRFGGRDFNLYRYVFNHPTGLTDPTGETAATNFLLVFGKINDLVSLYDDANGPSGQIGSACQIASWTATTFGYFGPLAELIVDPTLAAETPRLESEPLLQLAGCGEP